MTDTEKCQANASWVQIGKSVYTLPKFVYRIPCTPNTKMVDHIGAVKERSDGRWDWWRMRTNWHPSWNGEGQGVAVSMVDAKLKVLEGWS